MMVFVHATILGGLPVVASCSFGKDADTPNGPGEYWSEVDALYWCKRDGSRGNEVSQAIYDRCNKWDEYWSADVTEQANDWLREHAPLRWRDHTAPSGWREEGDWSHDYIMLNGDPREAGAPKGTPHD